MNRRIAEGAALGVLASWSTIGLMLTSGWLLSRAAQQPPVLYLMIAIVAVRAFGIARGALRYAERLRTHDGALRMLTSVRTDAFTALERRAPAGFGDRRRGDLVARVVDDVDALQDSVLRVRVPWAVTVATAAGTTVLVIVVLPPAGAVLVGAVCAVVTGVPMWLRLVGSNIESRLAPLRGELAAAVSEAVSTAPELVAYGATALVRDRVVEVDAQLRRAERHAAWLSGLGSAAVLGLVGVATGAILWIGVDSVEGGTLEPVLLAVVALAPIALLDPLDAVPAIAQTRVRVAGARERLASLSSAPLPVTDPSPADVRPSGYALEVEGLSAGWPEGPDVLLGVDLSVPEGGVATVTGPSGCGKSTLAAVLLKFLEPRAGTVRLGGVDLASLTGERVRAVVGMLGQDEHVFDTTIRENLRIADADADDAQLWAALGEAGLASFVRTLPRGLDTAVGENGTRLSGGERQRLGLARLLLGDHRVLILDEPTEQLDEDTGDALLTDLLALADAPVSGAGSDPGGGAGRSILLITHHPTAETSLLHQRDVTLAPASRPR